MKSINDLQAEILRQKEAYQASQKKLKAELRKAQKEAEREAKIAEQKRLNDENKIVCNYLRNHISASGSTLFNEYLSIAIRENNESQF